MNKKLHIIFSKKTSKGVSKFKETLIKKLDKRKWNIILLSFSPLGNKLHDEENNIYVTGGTNSEDFPVTQNAYQLIYQDSVNADAFVTKISALGNYIMHSTYYGTNEYDQSYFIEYSSKDLVYLLGQTESQSSSMINNIVMVGKLVLI